MPTIMIEPPAALPVNLPVIKQHLRLEHDADDAFLLELVSAATRHVETVTRQALIERTMRQTINRPISALSTALEVWPVLDILAVRAFDIEGNSQVLSGVDYMLLRGCDPAVLELNRNAGALIAPSRLEIDIRCGYGAIGTDVPGNLLQAIKVLVAHWYENRGGLASPAGDVLPAGIDDLLGPVRRRKL